METRYDRANKSFLIFDQPGVESACIEFPFEDHCRTIYFEEENIANYTFSIYFKNKVRETDCYNLFLYDEAVQGKKTRIGWVIPLSTLVTEDEELRSNPHLSCYVFLAYKYLFALPDFANIEDYKSFSEVVGTYLSPDACLVITNNDRIDASVLDRLELSFARYGFYKNLLSYGNNEIRLPANKKLVLYQTADIQDAAGNYIDPYFQEFISKHITESSPLIRFLHLYQIMEVLFNRVLVQKLKALLKDIEQDNGSTRELSEELKGQTEYARWEAIEKRAGMQNADYGELDKKCNAFLGRTANVLPHPNSVYQVRNHITHRFRKVITKANEISEICDLFELYLLDLLVNYKDA